MFKRFQVGLFNIFSMKANIKMVFEFSPVKHLKSISVAAHWKLAKGVVEFSSKCILSLLTSGMETILIYLNIDIILF